MPNPGKIRPIALLSLTSLILFILWLLLNAPINLLLLKKSADANDPIALNALGEYYLTHPAPGASDPLALACFQKSADLGNTDAMINLGHMRRDHRIPKSDSPGMVDWYAKACDAGSAAGNRHRAIRIMTTDNSYPFPHFFQSLASESYDHPAFYWPFLIESVFHEFDRADRMACQSSPPGLDNHDLPSLARQFAIARMHLIDGTDVIKCGCLRYTPYGFLESTINSATQGDPYAMAQLGAYYESPHTDENDSLLPPDFPSAINWYAKAAQTGDADAMLRLAALHETPDAIAALQNLPDTAIGFPPPNPIRIGYEGTPGAPARPGVDLPPTADGNGPALPWWRPNARVAAIWRQRAISRLHALADRGSAQAANRLGEIYASGHGTPQSLPKALALFQSAAQNQNAAAMCNLGILHEQGRGTPQNLPLALDWYTKSAIAGNAHAMFRIGLLLENHNDQLPKPHDAYPWFSTSYKMGSALAEDHLALQKQALETRAANNDADAMLQLAKHAADLDSDFKLAFEWIAQSAKAGNSTAMVEYAIVLYRGFNNSPWGPTVIEPDRAAANHWLDTAIAQGSTQAMIIKGHHQIGHVTKYFGQYLPRPPHDSAPSSQAKENQFFWLRRAALAGDIHAMRWLADNLPTDHAIEADQWRQKAISNQNPHLAQ